MFKFLFLLGLLAISTCETTYVNILNRGEHQTPLYRINAPSSWVKNDFHSNSDTKIPLCEFLIKEGESEVRITIHNFPTNNFEERIPPAAQINRWKNQFERIYQETLKITPQSFSGYSGYILECSGLLNKKNITLMAWILQLGGQHLKSLSNETKADVTIKIVGDSPLMEIYRDELISFARSFELIDELPEAS